MKQLTSPSSIVVIPALSITDTADHRRTQCSWLKLLIASTDEDTRVFLFHWSINPRGSVKGNVWLQILDHARVLLDSLRQARPFDVRYNMGYRESSTYKNRYNVDHFTSSSTVLVGSCSNKHYILLITTILRSGMR